MQAACGYPGAMAAIGLYRETNERIERVYGEGAPDIFFNAFQHLHKGLNDDPAHDILGHLFMNWGSPNAYRGQFFTPEELAWLMATVTLMGIDVQIVERLQSACTTSAAQAALAATGLDLTTVIAWTDEQAQQFCCNVLPVAAPYLTPLRSQEPCCGSGVMILAQIAILPRWISQVGLIQYQAIDIDSLCVAMCRLQTWSLGVPVHVICANALSSDELARMSGVLPPILLNAYASAAVAQVNGDTEKIVALTAAVNDGRAGEPKALERLEACLFDAVEIAV